MGFENLWAPWRMEFIKNAGAEEAGGCFLCRAASASDLAANLVVHRGEKAFVMLNRYPYNNGHLLISPIRHDGRLEAFTPEELTEVMAHLVRAKKLLDELVNPHGYNAGLNLGRAAGAGLEGHLHWHLVPRWAGDTNFMTSVASTKVIPQSLEELRGALSAAWAKSAAGGAPC